jgi:hypothetical protein
MAEVFVTVDRHPDYQQHLPGVTLAVVALQAHSIDVVDLEPLMPAVLTSPTLVAGGVTQIPTWPLANASLQLPSRPDRRRSSTVS